MSDWTDCKLGDLVTIKHGFAFKGEHFSDAGSHIVLTPGNFWDSGGFKEKGDKEKWYTGPIPDDYVLVDGDLIIAMTEQAEGLLGSSALIPKSGIYLHNQRLGEVLVKDSKKADKRFLYYLFNTRTVRQQIRGSASGTKIRHTAPTRVADVNVHVPDLRTQRRIAGILSAYDELIANNQRRIAVLEEMARALYREWFVYFRAPGVVMKEGDEVPEGWEVKRLGAIADSVRASSAKGLLEEEMPYVGLEHIPRRSLALDAWEMSTELGSSKLNFKKDDVLFGKIRPYFHKVSVAPFEGLCSSDTIVIRAKQPKYRALITGCAASDDFVAHATATSNGSKMPRADWKVLKDYPVAIAPDEILTKYSAVVGNAISQMQTLIFQSSNLGLTRDLLLPRLMSGRVEVGATNIQD